MTQHDYFYGYIDSPVGRLLAVFSDSALFAIEFEEEQRPIEPHWRAISMLRGGFPQAEHFFKRLETCLADYFAGKGLDLSGIALQPQGTAFQQAVWQALCAIPYGETVSYGDIAAQLGKPNAVRAVGGAVGRNPISILIPCHRVLGKNRCLTGFGGGLAAKRHLLALEGVAFNEGGKEFVSQKSRRWHQHRD